jgi:hypothetical protein
MTGLLPESVANLGAALLDAMLAMCGHPTLMVRP